MIEFLEVRVAPATLLTPTTVTYEDIDGDLVKVQVNKPIFTEVNVASLFVFKNAFENTGPQFLQTIDFAGLPAEANGIGITITVKRGAPVGDGAVYIFEINGSDVNIFSGEGSGIDLGKVSIQGAIGRIDAGDPDQLTPALLSLKAHAFGASGVSELSSIYGRIGSIILRGNFGGKMLVEGGDAILPSVGKLTIGGSLVPPDGVTGGSIQASSRFGTILVKGSIIGGSDFSTGYISTFGQIRSLTVGGSVLGGKGDGSGVVNAFYIGRLKIGGDIVGNDNTYTGVVAGVAAGIGKAVVGGSVIGGSGPGSGQIGAGGFGGIAGSIGSLLIKGSILGVPTADNNEAFGAGVHAIGSIGSLTVLGDVVHSNIIAGVSSGPNIQYGDDDDIDDPTAGPESIGIITKLVIKGGIYGSSDTDDSFGIQANKIFSARIGATIYKNTDPALNFANASNSRLSRATSYCEK